MCPKFRNADLNIYPTEFRHVMAISSGNSLYVATTLLHDPPSWASSIHPIRHTIGNVGRPGIALLASPRDLIVKDRDRLKWRLIKHADFDGKLESNFQSTSLHLFFTGY